MLGGVKSNIMKAKLLISFYRSEGGHKVHRVYLEPHFEQAQKDLDMIQDADSLGKDWELQECEVYNWKDIEKDVVREAQ
jgi:hypothetical protein